MFIPTVSLVSQGCDSDSMTRESMSGVVNAGYWQGIRYSLRLGDPLGAVLVMISF